MKNGKPKHSITGALILYLTVIWVAYLVATYCAVSPEEREFTMVGRLLSYMPQGLLEIGYESGREVTELQAVEPKIDKDIADALERLKAKGISPLKVEELHTLFGNTEGVPKGDIPILTNVKQFYAFVDKCIKEGWDSAEFYWGIQAAEELPSEFSLRNSGEYYLTGVRIIQGKQEKAGWRYRLSLFYSDFYRILSAVNDTKKQWQWMRLTPEELVTLRKLLVLVDVAIPRKEMSEQERALSIAKLLVCCVEYHALQDKESVFYKNRNKFVVYATQWEPDAAGNIKPGKAICEGYAQTYGLCLALAGVRSIPISGIVHRKAVEETSGAKKTDPGYHAWNYVQMNDAWYHVDPTWCDVTDPAGKQGFDEKWFRRTHQEMYSMDRAWAGCFPRGFWHAGQAPLP